MSAQWPQIVGKLILGGKKNGSVVSFTAFSDVHDRVIVL